MVCNESKYEWVMSQIKEDHPEKLFLNPLAKYGMRQCKECGKLISVDILMMNDQCDCGKLKQD